MEYLFGFFERHFKASTRGRYSGFTGQDVVTLPNYFFCPLGHTFLPEGARASLLDSDYFADFHNII